MKVLLALLYALIELLKVKSIVTMAVIGAMVYMAVKGTIDPATFMGVAGSVITYYFTRKDNTHD